MGDDVVDLSTENDALKNKIGSYDEKWLKESKARLLQQIDDEKRANLIMSRMKKQNRWINNFKWPIYLKIKYGKRNLILLSPKKIRCKICIIFN